MRRTAPDSFAQWFGRQSVVTPKRRIARGKIFLTLLIAIALATTNLSILMPENGQIDVANAADVCTPSSTSLVNPGFELPELALNASHLIDQDVAASPVPGWNTTDPTNVIEIWGSGFLSVPSFEGRQFAELNSYDPSTLYQDVTTKPGSELFWSLAHRARDLNGDPNPVTDVMRVVIGPPGGTLVQSGPDLSDTDAAWGTHTGTYIVPSGQTTTRFGFQAVSSGSGSPAAGNFLDAISFSGPACLTATLAVSQATAVAGDELTYTLTLANAANGAPTTSLVVSIPVPEGTTYVTGSASATGALSGGAVVFTQPSGGVLNAGSSVTLSFKVTVNSPLTIASATNVASVTAWPRNPTTFSSNSVVTTMPSLEGDEDEGTRPDSFAADPAADSGAGLAKTGGSLEALGGLALLITLMGFALLRARRRRA